MQIRIQRRLGYPQHLANFLRRVLLLVIEGVCQLSLFLIQLLWSAT